MCVCACRVVVARHSGTFARNITGFINVILSIYVRPVRGSIMRHAGVTRRLLLLRAQDKKTKKNAYKGDSLNVEIPR